MKGKGTPKEKNSGSMLDKGETEIPLIRGATNRQSIIVGSIDTFSMNVRRGNERKEQRMQGKEPVYLQLT